MISCPLPELLSALQSFALSTCQQEQQATRPVNPLSCVRVPLEGPAVALYLYPLMQAMHSGCEHAKQKLLQKAFHTHQLYR